MKKDLVSVIVPVYNVEKYLDRCIESIVNQTYKNLEIILVDDGSTDNSGKMCDDWKNKDKRIKVIHKKNGGLSDARNCGIKLSQGDFLAFVDSDDFINFEMYEILKKFIDEYDADVAVCKAKDFKKIEELENYKIKEKIDCIVYDDESKYDVLFNDLISVSVVVWNKLYKKDIFKDIKFPEGKIHEDVFIAHEIIDKSRKSVYINQELYYYFTREQSISNTFNLKRLDEIDGMKKRMEFFQQKKFIETKYLHLAHFSYVDKIIRHYCNLKKYNDNKKYNYKIKKLKKIFNDNYNEIMNYEMPFKKRFKYFIFRYFSHIFYLMNKKRFSK